MINLKKIKDRNQQKTSKSFELQGCSQLPPFELWEQPSLNEYAVVSNNTGANKLNDDCLMHIFSFLPIVDKINLERVCKRWRIVSQRAWNSLKKIETTNEFWGYKGEKRGFVDSFKLEKVLKHCGFYITDLDMSDDYYLCTKSWEIVGANCPNLITLKTTTNHCSYVGAEVMSKACTNVTKLTISGSRVLNDCEWQQLILAMKKLEIVKFLDVRFVNELVISCLPESIQEIELKTCRILSNDFQGVVPSFPKLRRFSISNSKTAISEEILISLSYKPNATLKSLNLANVKKTKRQFMDAEFLCAVLKNLVGLERLNICGNVGVNRKLLNVISNCCLHLVELDISRCNAIDTTGLISVLQLPKLENLKLTNIRSLLTEQAIFAMKNLKEMKFCSLSGEVAVLHELQDINARQICTLLRVAHRLQRLEVTLNDHLASQVITVAEKETGERNNGIKLDLILKVSFSSCADSTSVNTKLNTKHNSPLLAVHCTELRPTSTTIGGSRRYGQVLYLRRHELDEEDMLLPLFHGVRIRN